MPIRFHCKRCHQMLGIASRKAGSDIKCPKCGIMQVVPSEEAAAAAMVMNQSSTPEAAVQEIGNLVVYDDQPAVIETPRPRRSETGAGPIPIPASIRAPQPLSGDALSAEPLSGEPVPRGMVLFARRTLYVQAALFLVLGVVAFSLGYFIGRGDANYQAQVEQEEEAREQVPIRGTLVCKMEDGQVVADEDAVIIALPDGKRPQKKLSLADIRPRDPVLNPIPDPPPRNVRLIRELGGQYARADAKGEFFMVLPDQGVYRVLIISARATRPKGANFDEIDAEEIGEYFDLVEGHIDRQQYRWTKEEINVGFSPIEIEFDRIERE